MILISWPSPVYLSLGFRTVWSQRVKVSARHLGRPSDWLLKFEEVHGFHGIFMDFTEIFVRFSCEFLQIFMGREWELNRIFLHSVGKIVSYCFSSRYEWI